MTLLTMRDLDAWVTTQEVDPGDEWGKICIAAASDKVRSTANQPTWTIATAPVRARQIAAHLASRSFVNPESISTDGALGPLGGDRRVEELSRALHLTAAEILELEGMSPAGGVGGGSSLWIQPIDGGGVLGEDTLYFGTDPASDWMLPYLSADDVAAP